MLNHSRLTRLRILRCEDRFLKEPWWKDAKGKQNSSVHNFSQSITFLPSHSNSTTNSWDQPRLEHLASLLAFPIVHCRCFTRSHVQSQDGPWPLLQTPSYKQQGSVVVNLSQYNTSFSSNSVHSVFSLYRIHLVTQTWIHRIATQSPCHTVLTTTKSTTHTQIHLHYVQQNMSTHQLCPLPYTAPMELHPTTSFGANKTVDGDGQSFLSARNRNHI